MQGDGLLEVAVRPPLGWVLAALWGAVWGSFFNLAIHRLAAAAERDEPPTWLGVARESILSLRSLFHPPSRCPGCGAAIRWFDNVPILGWLLLGGRCRACREPISPRYPIVEAASLVLGLAVYLRFVVQEPAAPELQAARFLIYFFFAGALLVLALIDLDTTLLPFSITLPGIPAYFLLGRLLPDVSTRDALLGAAIGFGGLFLLRVGYAKLLKREGLGGGDEMLVGMIGALLGWRAIPVTLFLGSLVGSLISIPVLIVARLRDRERKDGPRLLRTPIPFGPFLALGGLVYLFFGKALWTVAVAWTLGPTD
jgi:leader peptidase (prepilin peptidase)/N-methyltransferase